MMDTTNKNQKSVFPRLLRRVRASLIDSVIYILLIVLWWTSLPYLQNFPGIARLAVPIVLWLMLDSLLVSTTGGTLGHHIMRIKIVDNRSLHHIGLFRALCRSFVKTFFGWLSLVFILVTKKHQALHDLVVGSTVVLIDPEKVHVSEHRTEQLPNRNYIYPAIWRRTLVIIMYLVILLIAVGFTTNSLLSANCIINSRCTNSETSLEMVMGTLVLIVASVIFVRGCRGLLPGAKRQSNN